MTDLVPRHDAICPQSGWPGTPVPPCDCDTRGYTAVFDIEVNEIGAYRGRGYVSRVHAVSKVFVQGHLPVEIVGVLVDSLSGLNIGMNEMVVFRFTGTTALHMLHYTQFRAEALLL